MDQEFESLWAAFEIQLPELGSRPDSEPRFAVQPAGSHMVKNCPPPPGPLPQTAPANVTSCTMGLPVTHGTARPLTRLPGSSPCIAIS